MKDTIKAILHFFKLDLTKNIQYDRLTNLILKQVIKQDSNCIDIGCHKGEILEVMMKHSPNGSHFAFEPIPSFFDNLKQKFDDKCIIYPYALSDEEGEATFNFVKNAPAYSGLNKRKYAIENPEIEEINVTLKKLDDLIPADKKISLIKIDVEGAEYKVLQGAKELITRDKPVVIFECGLGASDFYGTDPKEVFEFFESCGLKLSLLKSWINKRSPLTLDQFKAVYKTNEEYYFIAHS
ncbi:MAG: FkbM family methyltransferase [Saprospiraceae bacterium]|jgi:FkbM family methyltransferase